MKTFKVLSAWLALTILTSCGTANSANNNADVKDAYNGWCHTQLKASDGTRIKLDYQILPPSGRLGIYNIKQMWINVQRNGASPSTQVRAVLVRDGSTISSVDLDYADGNRLTGEFPRVYANGARHYDAMNLELAVVANGKWLSDPISGSNNFNFNVRSTDQCRTN